VHPFLTLIGQTSFSHSLWWGRRRKVEFKKSFSLKSTVPGVRLPFPSSLIRVGFPLLSNGLNILLPLSPWLTVIADLSYPFVNMGIYGFASAHSSREMKLWPQVDQCTHQIFCLRWQSSLILRQLLTSSALHLVLFTMCTYKDTYNIALVPFKSLV